MNNKKQSGCFSIKNRVLKPRVAILGSYPPIRGISPYCHELSNSLSYYVRDIKFISFKKIYPSFLYPDGANQSDYTTHTDVMPNILIKRNLCWFNPISWIREAMDGNFDILHAQWWSLPLLPIYFTILLITKFKKKPIVLTVHNVIAHESSMIYTILTSLLLKTADHFIVHTKTNKNQLISCFNIPEKSITIIPHGPISLYKNSDDLKSYNIDLRQKLNIDESCKIILLFGAIREYKGIDIAIKAVEKICKQGVNCHLVVAGKAWIAWEQYDNLIQQLNMKNRVTAFTEYIPSDQVKYFFNCADLVIMPYRHFDAQSGVASVAGAFGKPMIVSDTGGLADWVSDKRWAVPPGDVDALAKAIKTSLEDHNILNKMAIDSQKTAQIYSWDAIARKTSELYQTILNDKL